MKIGILGTGMVGRTLAAKLTAVGHTVTLGTRDPAETKARDTPDMMGNPGFKQWHDANISVHVVTFAESAAHAEIVINATAGVSSLAALKAAGVANLAGKILIDAANPLDFSKGMPPTLTVCNTDSLGEQIQRAFATVKVVKVLNTLSAPLMVAPETLAGGEHELFMCGNDADAKKTVAGYLRQWFGWKHIRDVGDISNARGTEMLLPFWIRMYGALKTPMFNYRIVT